MQISLADFSRERLRAVWKEPFPLIIFSALVLTLVGLGYQSWFYFLGTDNVPQTDEVVAIDMRVVKGQWLWEPSVIEVPSGARVDMRITNEDAFAHGFAITELGIDQRLPSAQTTEFSFVASIEPGTYDFFCSVFCGAGHFGQRGQMIVTESDTTLDDVSSEPDTVTSSSAPVRSRADAIDELPYRKLDSGIKEFTLTVDEIQWDYGDGNPILSWGYNAQLPGPDIRVTEGDEVRIIVINNLPEATTVHWHGIDLEWQADGVPGITQEPIAPGDTYVYEFTAYPAGTRFYHTHGSHHGDEAEQIDMGLAGAFIIDPAEPADEVIDVDTTWVLTERIRNGIYPIHGSIYPSPPEIVVREGDRVRVRLINAGSSTFHPMHLHGHQFNVVAVDGNPVPEAAQLTRNTLPILPGETYDIEFIADNPGIWLFHCHELQHAAGGMIGLVRYEGFDSEQSVGHSH